MGLQITLIKLNLCSYQAAVTKGAFSRVCVWGGGGREAKGHAPVLFCVGGGWWWSKG